MFEAKFAQIHYIQRAKACNGMDVRRIVIISTSMNIKMSRRLVFFRGNRLYFPNSPRTLPCLSYVFSNRFPGFLCKMRAICSCYPSTLFIEISALRVSQFTWNQSLNFSMMDSGFPNSPRRSTLKSFPNGPRGSKMLVDIAATC